MINITLPDNSIKTFDDYPAGMDVAKAISEGFARNCVAMEIDGNLLDLNQEINKDCRLRLITSKDREAVEILRHSAAHVMAEAVQNLYENAQLTIGPVVEDGFYYDIDMPPVSEEDFPAIEAEIKKIIKARKNFERIVVTKDEALDMFKDNPYKIELIEGLEDQEISLYRQGGFTDLCRGPHIPSTGKLKAFKLLSVAGAYWRGDEKNKMLQRIYGTAFGSEKELKAHLLQIEEAKKRDHRKLGPALDLFSFHEQGGAGMAYWHPKGALLRTILEDFVNKEMLARGYGIVRTPQILKRDLWETSGHYENYRENMYFTEIDEQPYGVKPMNCVAHMMIYNSALRSYRDLPLRYFELGVVHRHEKSGVLHGLLRVRQFTQDDAHIICRPDQLQDEIKGVMNWIQDLMGVFEFEYSMEISTRPEKSIGSDEDWDRATRALIDAMDDMDLPYQINEGDGAFYGPKIDVKLHDCLGREWQCSTIQVDFTLPDRFDMVYIGEDGERHRPVMVHRAIMGSVERFIGILTEHYAGGFPTWLAPVQARICNVTDSQKDFAESALATLQAQGVRVEADLRNEKLGYKIREAQVQKVPYILVIGDKEVESGGVNVRLRGENLGLKSLDEAVKMVLEDCQEPFKRGGMSYSFNSISSPA